MVDVLSATSAASGLLDIAIRTLGRIRQAYDRQKDLAGVLDSHTSELRNVKRIIQIIRDEETLQTEIIASDLVKLKAVEDRLIKWLQKVDPGTKGPVRQFSHQLVHGNKEEKKLGAIMDELSRRKSDLILRIQLAAVGVMRNVEKEVVANSEVISKIDGILVEMLGKAGGLRIAQLLKDRHPRSDGTVPLNEKDIALLKAEQGTPRSDRKSVAASERIITRNDSEGQAVQLNAPVGEDIWRDISRLEITDNKAKEASTQVNYATSLEVLKFLMDRQDARLEQERRCKYQTRLPV